MKSPYPALIKVSKSIVIILALFVGAIVVHGAPAFTRSSNGSSSYRSEPGNIFSVSTFNGDKTDCRITTNSTTDKAYFIPVNTSAEWKSFVDAVTRLTGMSIGNENECSGERIYSTVGNDSFLVPSGVTSVQVTVTGGGGGGGGGGGYGYGGGGGGGGAGGQIDKKTITVVPGGSIPVRVGSGGDGGLGGGNNMAGSPGVDGGASSFGDYTGGYDGSLGAYGGDSGLGSTETAVGAGGDAGGASSLGAGFTSNVTSGATGYQSLFGFDSYGNSSYHISYGDGGSGGSIESDIGGAGGAGGDAGAYKCSSGNDGQDAISIGTGGGGGSSTYYGNGTNNNNYQVIGGVSVSYCSGGDGAPGRVIVSWSLD